MALRRIFVANRGEIALRVVRACRDLGIESVQAYSSADAETLPVRLADSAVEIGGPQATESYLKGEAIIAAAKQAGADAIHPGYGFLSENAAFSDACAEAGLAFIGRADKQIKLDGRRIELGPIEAAICKVMTAALVPRSVVLLVQQRLCAFCQMPILLPCLSPADPAQAAATARWLAQVVRWCPM